MLSFSSQRAQPVRIMKVRVDREIYEDDELFPRISQKVMKNHFNNLGVLL